jgi:serine phosphatase RsbU (regulator of sigma subunit)
MWRRLVDVARKRRSFWSSVPPRGHALILAAAFATFAGIGFLTDILSIGRNPLPIAFVIAGLSGAFAVFWALTIIRSAKFLPLAVALYLFMFWLNENYETRGLSFDPAGLAAVVVRVKIDAAAVIIAVSVGYALFIVFIAVEGRRYMRAHTEVALAQDIHRHLVPSIDRTVGRFECFGMSLPSSEVGGDLVDVVEAGERWVAYVADVSGHGVASGTLMGMFKSAVRTRLAADASLDVMLTDVNRVLTGLRKPGMFVTCAFLTGDEGRADRLRFAVAGHPPILHRRDGSGAVEELSMPQLPMALLDQEPAFVSATVHVDCGDVLALVSDGLMEVFDRHDEGYGLDRLKITLAAHAMRPLQDLFDAIVADVRRHGTQLDDQSLLLVRVLR